MRAAKGMPVAAHLSALRMIGTTGTASASSDRHSATPVRPEAPITWTWTGLDMMLRLTSAAMDGRDQPGHDDWQEARLEDAVDPVTVSVVQHRLHAIVEEMGEAMLRTSYSQILNSSRDFSTAICDINGRLIAQAEHVPIHVGALPWAANTCARREPAAAGMLNVAPVPIGLDVMRAAFQMKSTWPA